jgi:histidinol dehydrogenase
MERPLTVRVFHDAQEGRDFILGRRNMGQAELSPGMRAGVKAVFGEELSADEVVERILTDVEKHGDIALRRYTAAIDGVELRDIRVSESEFEHARRSVPAATREALEFSAERIRSFHERQHVGSWFEPSEDGTLGQIIRPLERVGVYAPGGTAPYPSSLLMTAVPANVAGVDEIIVCAPPERDGNVAAVTLVAAEIAGAQAVYKLGGAQAIGAMAFGTESVPKVDKILGPGNIFVVLAKRRVYGHVDIDALPGPTETVLIADQSANPELTAADLLAQAEHDPMASAILLTTSAELATAVEAELDAQLESLSRADIAQESLNHNGAIVVLPHLDAAFDLANAYAPEHLCLLVHDPWAHIGKVRHAGGVFLGEDSPEVIGDYTAGPSHVMPTGQTARFSSPVNVLDFVKVISVIGLSAGALETVGPPAIEIAEAEGLTAHAAAVRRRLQS